MKEYCPARSTNDPRDGDASTVRFKFVAALSADHGVDGTAPIAFLPLKTIANPTLGRVMADDANYEIYRSHLRKTIEEPFALFVQDVS